MKRQTLNAEKRKNIEGVFQSHWIEHSPYNKGLQEAKEEYNQMRPKMLQLCENIVRQYQPQQDVDTIRAMIKNMIVLVASYTTTTVLIFKQILLMTRENLTPTKLVSVFV